MAYTPELNYIDSGILKRLSGARRMPMTKVLHEIVTQAAARVDMCSTCQDQKDKFGQSFCVECTGPVRIASFKQVA